MCFDSSREVSFSRCMHQFKKFPTIVQHQTRIVMWKYTPSLRMITPRPNLRLPAWAFYPCVATLNRSMVQLMYYKYSLLYDNCIPEYTCWTTNLFCNCWTAKCSLLAKPGIELLLSRRVGHARIPIYHDV